MAMEATDEDCGEICDTDLDRTFRAPLSSSASLEETGATQVSFPNTLEDDLDGDLDRTFRAPVGGDLLQHISSLQNQIEELRRSHEELRRQVAGERDARVEFERNLSWKLLDQVKEFRSEFGAGEPRVSNWPLRGAGDEDDDASHTSSLAVSNWPADELPPTMRISDAFATDDVVSRVSSDRTNWGGPPRVSDMFAPCPRDPRVSDLQSVGPRVSDMFAPNPQNFQDNSAGRPSVFPWAGTRAPVGAPPRSETIPEGRPSMFPWAARSSAEPPSSAGSRPSGEAQPSSPEHILRPRVESAGKPSEIDVEKSIERAVNLAISRTSPLGGERGRLRSDGDRRLTFEDEAGTSKDEVGMGQHASEDAKSADGEDSRGLGSGTVRVEISNTLLKMEERWETCRAETVQLRCQLKEPNAHRVSRARPMLAADDGTAQSL